MSELLECCDIDERRFRCLVVAALSGGDIGGEAEIVSDTNTSIVAGYQGVSIRQDTSTGTVEITGTLGTFVLNKEDMVLNIKAPPGKLLPAITIESNDGASWSWIAIV